MHPQNVVKSLSLALGAVTIAVASTVTLAPPASGLPVRAGSTAQPQTITPMCMPTISYRWTVKKGGTKMLKNFKSESEYNNTEDVETVTRTATVTKSQSDTSSWEVGGETGIDIKVWSAKVEGKYGESAVTGVASSESVSKTITIRPGYSGWYQADIWRQNYIVSRYKVYNGCPRDDELVGRLIWHDKYKNGSSHTRKGRVGW